MKILKRVLIGLLAIVVLATLGFVVWAETPYKPAPEALFALQSDAEVKVTAGDYIAFMPANSAPATGFVFYPGGRVDFRAYAAPLRQVAKEGYLVILLPVRLNLAFFDVNAAGRAIADHPEIQHWVVGGHSLGGVASALYAAKQDHIDGIVFWASYPANDALRNKSIKVLSIYGTRDMGGTEAFEESRAHLPPDAEFVVIEGGNHGQFGDYGFQPGDNQAAISRQEQQYQVVKATVRFLASLSK